MRLKLIMLLAVVGLLQVMALGQKPAVSEAELRKQADKLFQEQAYSTAVGSFSQLLSLNPNDLTLNYRYGVSLLLSGKDKRSAVTYLEKAMNDQAQPLEGWVYLGRGYMFLGKYEDAKRCFLLYMTKATDQQRKKIGSDEWLRAANAASELVRQRRLISVTSQKEISRTAFFTQIDFSKSAGRMMPAVERFLTSTDKAKQAAPAMYMSRDGQTIYYASYGKNSSGGKDLYLIRKMTNGEWAQPENLGSIVNSPSNEDFPFLDRDGKTLYFASEGHNSIGGYDLFKSVFNFNTGQWSQPENLGIPLNSPDDDLLYVPGSDGTTATYATCDLTDNAHTELRTIRIDDLRNPFATIQGTYISVDQPMRRDARVIVLRAADQSVVTTVRTDPRTGSYELVLPGGESYWLVVDGGGYVPHTEAFDLPAGLENAALKQQVRMERTKQDERMTVMNYFTPVPSSAGAAVTAVNDRPTSSQTSNTTQTSESVQVTVGGETLTIRKPLSQPDAASDVLSSSAPVALTDSAANESALADKYDPMLERGKTQEELRQQQEEQLRQDEIAADEKIPVEQLGITVDERELARAVFEDGLALQREADSLLRTSRALNVSAASREVEAVRLYEEAQTSKEDTSRAADLFLQSEENEQLALREKQQALELDALARERRGEAEQTLSEAKVLINSSNNRDIALIAEVDRALANNTRVTENETTSTLASNRPAEQVNQSENQDTVDRQMNEIDSKESENAVTVAGESVKATTGEGIDGSREEQSISAAAKPALIDDPQAAAVSDQALVAANEAGTQAEQSTGLSPSSDKKSELPVNPIAGESNNQSLADDTSRRTEIQQDPIAKEQQATVPTEREDSERRVAPTTIKQQSRPHETSPSPAELTQQPEAEQKPVRAAVTAIPGNQAAGLRAENTSSISTAAIEPTAEKSFAAEAEKEMTPKESLKKANTTPQLDQPVDVSGVSAEGSRDKTPRAASNEATDNQAQPSASQSAAVRAENPTAENSGSPAANRTTPSQSISTSVNQLTEVPVIEGVSESSRMAYQNFKQRMELSERLDDQSSQIKTQVATMENSPERDSLAELANSMTLESIRQWQSAQQQLREAKLDDPDIESKAEAAIAAAKSSQPALDPRSTAMNNTVQQDMAVNTSTPANAATKRVYPETGADFTKNPTSKASAMNERELPAPGINGSDESRTANSTGNNRVGESNLPEDDAEPAKADRNNPAGAEYNSDAPATVSEQNETTGAAAAALSNPEATSNPSATAIDRTEADGPAPVSNTAQRSNTPAGSDENLLNDRTDRIAAIAAAGDPSNEQGVNNAAETLEKTAASESADRRSAITDTESAPTHQLAAAETSNQRNIQSAENSASNSAVTEQSDSSGSAPIGAEPFAREESAATERVSQSERGINAPVSGNLSLTTEVPREQLDSTHQDYPRYMELRKRVGEQQDETIRLFASALELNKQASREKQEQVDLMQKAESTADVNEKQKLLRQSEKRKRESESHEIEAGKLMTQAQKLSDEIWESSQQLDAMNLAIRKSGTVRTSSGTSAVNPTIATTRRAPVPETDETLRTNATSTSPQAAGDRSPAKSGPLTVPGIERMTVRSDKPAYSNDSPIPVDQALPEGLIFKVQIGAFRKPIPNEAFGGLSPVSAENTRPGWIRYCVGVFRTFEPANTVKKAMRGQGFKDAFVVAYYNGKRIALGEAYALLNQAGSDSRTAYASASRAEMQRLRELDIVPVRSAVPDPDEQEFFGGTVASNAVNTGGVAYAVQVGVYRSAVPPVILGSLQPLQQEPLAKGLFRYTTGRYVAYASADSMRRVAVNTGIKDAFVVAYRDGRRVSLSSIARSSTPATARTTSSSNTPEAPVETPSTQSTGEAITFRVQVGAFRKQVPFQVVDALLKVSDRGVDREQDPRGLQVFFAGRFPDYETARKLKEEVAGRGVPDAFVVAFSGRQRIPLAEALRRLGQ